VGVPEPLRHSVRAGHHALKGGLLVTENGEDERVRATTSSPDRLQLAQQNRDGSPDYHGGRTGSVSWIQLRRFSNPVGVPGDDNPAPSL